MKGSFFKAPHQWFTRFEYFTQLMATAPSMELGTYVYWFKKSGHPGDWYSGRQQWLKLLREQKFRWLQSKLMLACAQGIHFKLSNLPDIVVRFSRGDVNMPNYDAFPFDVLVSEAKFEAAVYELLRSDVSILASRLLYYRVPVQHVPARHNVPQIFLVVDCSCLKDQKEIKMYGMSSAPKIRYVLCVR